MLPVYISRKNLVGGRGKKTSGTLSFEIWIFRNGQADRHR